MTPLIVGLLAASATPYAPRPDPHWKPAFPKGAHTFSAVGIAFAANNPNSAIVFVTQRGNASIDPVLVLNASDGSLLTSWGKSHVALTPSPPPRSWGAHGLSIEQCDTYPCGEGRISSFFRVWIEDFTGHTMRCFSATGRLLDSVGTPGIAGNGTSPIQFGNVADAAVVAGVAAPSSPPTPGTVYASDGDGGSANRVIAFETPSNRVLWATPAVYANPHSIALHDASQLLVVADREHSQLRLLRARDGLDLGAWDACDLHFGSEGRPYGVRTLSRRAGDMARRGSGGEGGASRDYLFVASMDNPQDGRFQRITVIDASGLSAAAGTRSPCKVVQTIPLDPAEYSGPHLLGVDRATGDLYAALVADKPRSTVLRFKCVDC